MSTSIICDRSFEFGCRIVALCERLDPRGLTGRHVAHQLIRCGTSIGANAEESQEAQSKREFVSTLNISRKEARETRFWLRLAIRARIVSALEIEWEVREVSELLAMLTAAINTARHSLGVRNR